MPYKVSDVFLRVNDILGDQGAVVWGNTSLLPWFNDVRIQIITLKPSAYPTTEAFQLAAGTRQSLPTGGIALIRPIRNAGSAGQTVGKAIQFSTVDTMDKQIPGWHNDTPNAEVLFVLPDPAKDPKKFYVFPPQPSPASYLLAEYSKVPAAATSENDDILIGDEYMPALVDGIVHRALSGDREMADAGLAERYKNAFFINLGLKPPGADNQRRDSGGGQ